MLQLVLLALVSVQTLFHASSTLPYFNRQTDRFRHAFFGFESSGQWVGAAAGGSGRDTLEIATIPAFLASLTSTCTVYAGFVNNSIDGYAFSTPHVPTVSVTVGCDDPPAGTTYNASAAAAATSICSGVFGLTASAPTGPWARLSPLAWRAFLDRVSVSVSAFTARTPPRRPRPRPLQLSDTTTANAQVTAVELRWKLIDTQVSGGGDSDDVC